MIAAMAAAIALWLTNLLLDAQTARNSVFPEGACHRSGLPGHERGAGPPPSL